MDRSGAGSTIQFLREPNNGNIVYSTGIMACFPAIYRNEIVVAARSEIFR
jgi:hypothetical protein